MIATIQAWRRNTNPFARVSQSPRPAARLVPRWTPPSVGQEARIRRVFRIEAAGRPLPKVNEESVARYREYLAENLSFPFDAQFYDAHEGAVCDHLVTATRLRELVRGATVAACGVECEILVWGGPVVVPLSGLRSGQRTANRQLIDDYRHWLRGWQ